MASSENKHTSRNIKKRDDSLSRALASRCYVTTLRVLRWRQQDVKRGSIYELSKQQTEDSFQTVDNSQLIQDVEGSYFNWGPTEG